MNRFTGNLTAAIGSGNPIQFAASYTVYVTPVGGRVATSGNGTTHTLDRGHSFRVGDRFLLNPGVDNILSTSITVVSPTANTIKTGVVTYNLVAGDLLVNLGPDTSSGAIPEYDQIPMAITDQPDGGSIFATPSVNTDATGNYAFYHNGDGKFWLLLLDPAGTPSAVQQGVGGMSRNNVCDYGARPGETGSSTVAIETAAHALPSGGGDIYFPPGDYMLGARVDIDRGNIRVVFARGARLVIDAVGITALQIQGTVSARIADVEIIDPNIYDSDASAHSGGEESTGINVAYCDGVTIVRGNFYGLGDEAIVLNSCTNFYVDSPEIEECCLLDSNSGSLSLNGTLGGILNAPRITNNGTGAAIRIEVTDPPTEAAALANDITIVAPYIDTCRDDSGLSQEDDGVGIAIVPNNRTGRSVTILGGTIKDADKCAVYCVPVGGTGTMLSIQGLHVKDGGDNAKTSTWRGALNIAEGWVQGSIIGCVIDGWGNHAEHHGIRVAKDNFAILGNTIINLTADAYSIRCDGDGTDGNVIIGNISPSSRILPGANDLVWGNKTSTTNINTLDNNATPHVRGANFVKTGGTTTITDFDAGQPGQLLTILAAHSVTITDNANIILAGNANFDMVAGDTLTLMMYDDQVWNEVARSTLTLAVPAVVGLADSATPSVADGVLFKTGGTTTITNFTGGVVGQTIRILSDHAITITDNATIELAGVATNFVMAANDTLTLTMFDSGVWSEIARSVNAT